MIKLKNMIINFFSAIKKNQYPEFRYIQKKKDINPWNFTQEENEQNKHFKVNVSFADENTLNIEFFDEKDNIEIIIYNQYIHKEVYKISISTAPKLHIIVDMERWLPGFYYLVIQDENCIFLERSFPLRIIFFQE